MKLTYCAISGEDKKSCIVGMVVVVAVPKKQVDMLLSVLPCLDAVCCTLPVQLKRFGGESFKLSPMCCSSTPL